jgi:hypothetical protein
MGNASHYFKLWVQDTGGNISADSNLAQLYAPPNPPAGLVTGAISSSTVAVTWSAANNNTPIEYGVWADTDAVEPVISSSPFKTPDDRSYTFTGLTPDTTYFLYVAAKNPETVAMSVRADMGSVVTYAAQPGPLTASTVFISSFTLAWSSGGNPDWTEYRVRISTAADWSGAVVESGWLKALEYSSSGLLEGASYYAAVKARNSVGVETAYTDLGVLKTGRTDTLPPATELMFTGEHYGAEPVYISSRTVISLIAFDDAAVVGDRLGGVAASYYSVDSDTFSVYAGSFSVTGENGHVVRYYSADTAGNTETVKTSSVAVDNTAPISSMVVNGQPIADGGTAYMLVGDSVTLISADDGSGVKETLYAADAAFSTQTVSVYSAPLQLSAGTHAVYYAASDNTGNQSAVRSCFVVVSSPAVIMNTIAPSSGPIGLPVTISGVGFGSYRSGYTTVLLGDTTAPITVWNDTTVKFTVPGALGAGIYDVKLKRVSGSTVTLISAPYFTVTLPELYGLEPSSGPIGIPFTLLGASFGNYKAGSARVLIGGTTSVITQWTDTKIKGTAPSLEAGDYGLWVEREFNGGLVRTSSLTFSIITPVIDAIAPFVGPIGLPFTLTGNGFGNYKAGFTRVLFGDTTAQITSWSDTQIKATVPGSLVPGVYALVIERELNGGTVASGTVIFEVAAINLSSMTPVAGPIGVPFTLYGSGFGNYRAGYTRVLMGGTTTPVTLWSDTQIKGTVPGTIPAGDQSVSVERELNGGVVPSAYIHRGLNDHGRRNAVVRAYRSAGCHNRQRIR